MFDMLATPAHALVAKTDLVTHAEKFLRVDDGAPCWVADASGATTFASMREAIRMATRLPAAVRAYGVPAGPKFDA